VERLWVPQRARTSRTSLLFFAEIDQYDIPVADKDAWREAAANTERLINDPDFCYREGFVLAVGSKAT